jgi:hypothetical protein
MNTLKEFIDGYAAPVQREVLAGLCADLRIEKFFFLTGGTALSVFYLGHRVSEDLDLFTLDASDLPDIGFWIVRNWPNESAALRQSPGYLSVEIKGVRVDLVVDSLSERADRGRVVFESGRSVAVDTIGNIASNKLATLVSRIEPKDFIDFYFIRRTYPEMRLGDIFEEARRKEAVFDDPPTAAFQLEEGFERLKDAMEKRTGAAPGEAKEKKGTPGREAEMTLFPRMLKTVDWDDFRMFYHDLAAWLYGVNKGSGLNI